MFHLLILRIMTPKQIQLLEQAYEALVLTTTSLLSKEQLNEFRDELGNIIDVRVLIRTVLILND